MGVADETQWKDLVSTRTFEIPACKGFMLHVDNSEVREFFETFHNTYRLFTKLADDEKLLLSTCGTIERCFDAIAYEVHSWAGTVNALQPNRRTFGDGIHGAITDLKNQADMTAV